MWQLTCLAIFLTPFYTFRISAGLNITASDVVFVSCLLILLSVLVVRGRIRIYRGDLRYRDFAFVWPIAAIMITLGFLISDVFAAPPIDRTVSTAVQYWMVMVVPPLVMLTNSERYSAHYCRAFLVGMLVTAGLAIVLKLGLPGVYDELVRSGIFIGRDRMGSFMGSNGLGKTIGTTFPLLLYQRYALGMDKRRWIMAITVLIIGLFMASSFGGTITTIAGITTTLLLYLPRMGMQSFSKVQGKAIGVAVSVFMGFCALILLHISGIDLSDLTDSILHTYRRRVAPVLATGDILNAGSLSTKLDLAREALDWIESSPVLGMGSRQFVENQRQGITVHNTYLLLWSEGGILSFLGLLTMLVGCIVLGALRYRSRFEADWKLGVVLLSTTVATGVAMMTNNYSYGRFELMPLWISFYLAVVTVTHSRQPACMIPSGVAKDRNRIASDNDRLVERRSF